VRQFLSAHWLFVPGQNSRVAATVFYREVHYFRVARNPSKIDVKRGDHCLQADLNEAARAADASREAKGAVYGERLK